MLPLAGTAGATREEIRAAIVNPARLSPDREMEVCLQCHLETTSRLLPHAIPRLNRGPFDYMPGQPLGDFRLDFDRAPGQERGFRSRARGLPFAGFAVFSEERRKTALHVVPQPARHSPGRSRGAPIQQRLPGLPRGASGSGTPGPGGLRRLPYAEAANRRCGAHRDDRSQDRPAKPPGDLLADKPEKHETPANSYRGEVMPYYPEKPAQDTGNRDVPGAGADQGSQQSASRPAATIGIDREVSSRSGRVSIPVWARVTGRRAISPRRFPLSKKRRAAPPLPKSCGCNWETR